MTAVLAEAVGPSGRVVAVDIASPDYGSPETLQEATDAIKSSSLGSRVDFRFQFDPLDPANDWGDGAFDDVVLAHSSWYFATKSQLAETFAKAHRWAKRLRLAEWDLQPRHMAQLPHLLAVSIQAQIEAFKESSTANVRTPLAVSEVKALLDMAGWKVAAEELLDAPDLQDADWEIRAALAALEEVPRLGIPSRCQAWLDTQGDLLRTMARPSGNRPLGCYALTAVRS